MIARRMTSAKTTFRRLRCTRIRRTSLPRGIAYPFRSLVFGVFPLDDDDERAVHVPTAMRRIGNAPVQLIEIPATARQLIVRRYVLDFLHFRTPFAKPHTRSRSRSCARSGVIRYGEVRPVRWRNR